MCEASEYLEDSELTKIEDELEHLEQFEADFREQLALACVEACQKRDFNKINVYRDEWGIALEFIEWMRQQDSTQFGDNEFMKVMLGVDTLEIFEDWLKTANFKEICEELIEQRKPVPDFK